MNVLKIDRSFIDNIAHQQSKELASSSIAISKYMKLPMIAEETERLEQVEMLTIIGGDYFQGYYFSRLLTPEDFAAYVMR